VAAVFYRLQFQGRGTADAACFPVLSELLQKSTGTSKAISFYHRVKAWLLFELRRLKV